VEGISLQIIIDDDTKKLHNIITEDNFKNKILIPLLEEQTYNYIVDKTTLPHEFNIIDSLRKM